MGKAGLKQRHPLVSFPAGPNIVRSLPRVTWNRKHFLDIQSLSAEEITFALDTAKQFKAVGERAIKKVPALRTWRSPPSPTARLGHRQRQTFLATV